jgi:dienelactone hydrolase
VRRRAHSVRSHRSPLVTHSCLSGSGPCALCKLCSFISFVRRFSWGKRLKHDVLETVLPFFKQQGCEKLGVLGFCWGAYVVHHASADPAFSCGAAAHPSTEKIAGLLGEKFDQVLDGVRCPQLLLPAGNDGGAMKPGGKAHVRLRAANGEEHGCRVQTFPKMKHGWVVRGDMSQPDVHDAAHEATGLLADFFETWLLPV